MFRDLVTSDDVKQDYVVGYEKLLNKSGFEVFESSEVEEGKESLVFDSANSFAFFFASRVTLGLKEFSSQMKAGLRSASILILIPEEKTDLPALIKAGDELLKDLVSLFSTLTRIAPTMLVSYIQILRLSLPKPPPNRRRSRESPPRLILSTSWFSSYYNKWLPSLNRRGRRWWTRRRTNMAK